MYFRTKNHKILLGVLLLMGTVLLPNLVQNTQSKEKSCQWQMKWKGNQLVVEDSKISVIQAQFPDAQTFSEDLAAVKSKTIQKWGYIDSKGKQAIAFQFEQVWHFNEGLAGAVKELPKNKEEEAELGFIDRTGKFQIEPRFSTLATLNVFFSEGLMYIPDLQAFIDKTGKTVLKVPAEIYDPILFSEGLSLTRDMNNTDEILFGYINKQGELIGGYQWETHGRFWDGLGAVRKNEKWGYIDKTGKIAIPLQYLEVYDFHEGIAAVKPEGSETFGFINKKGEMIIPPQFSNLFYFGKQKIAGVKNGKTIVTDLKGKPLFEGTWQKLTPFVNGVALYKKNDLWGFLDENGKEVTEPMFESLEHGEKNRYLFKKNELFGYIIGDLCK